ncbi:MAG: flagellar M-ring protein FliF [Aquificae bacterium]|nr:flagellar M-ring protein FliF [Aquificota bacterium]
MDFESIKNKIPENIRDFLTARNIAIFLTGLLLISLLSIVAIKSFSKEEYAVLYTHLSPDDAGSILAVLQEENIPYKVEGDGSIILVPKDKVYEIRLKLAAKGLPSSKTVGFEIFEEPKMGITHFQENINYLRALEGELARTIKEIDAIQSARVNIALPKESIFVRETDEPKASVVVKLWPGRELTKEQIKAIVFLVSHAVPGLKPENVTVVDNKGRVLSDVLEEENLATGKTIDIKRKLEKQIEKNVYAILSRALGPDKVAVKASVDIEVGNFRQREEIYDPDRTAVVSERKIQETEQGVKTTPAGAPGTATNVPPVVQGATGGTERTQRSKKDITKNYDVTKTFVDTQKPIFRIKRVTVGVLLDGKYIKETTPDGKTVEKFVPLSKEEIQQYKALVESVVGFNPERGDKITVVSVPFSKTKADEFYPYIEEKQKITFLIAVGIIAFILALAGLLFFLLKRKKAEKLDIPEITGVSPEAAANIYGMYEKEIEELKIEREPIYKKILEVSEESPELIAKLLSKWLKEEK